MIQVLILTCPTAMISESQSPRSSQLSTPTNARNCASSTRTRSTSLSISDQSRPGLFGDDSRRWTASVCWRRSRSDRCISLSESSLSRYGYIKTLCASIDDEYVVKYLANTFAGGGLEYDGFGLICGMDMAELRKGFILGSTVYHPK